MEQSYGHGADRNSPSPLRAPVSWLAILAALIIWSGVVYVGYVALDAVGSWLTANTGAVLKSGKGLADTLGVGKELGGALERVGGTSFPDQAIAMLRPLLMPAALLVWALGLIAIAILPRFWRMIAGGVLTRRH